MGRGRGEDWGSLFSCICYLGTLRWAILLARAVVARRGDGERDQPPIGSYCSSCFAPALSRRLLTWLSVMVVAASVNMGSFTGMVMSFCGPKVVVTTGVFLGLGGGR